MAARKDPVDLDKIVDYRAEYAAVVEGLKPGGEDGGLIGRCPFHNDRNRSFSVNPKTGMWHCFSEDEGGNFVTFWAKLHNIDTKQAYKEILEKYHVSTEKPKAAKREKTPSSLESYTLEQYSFDKHLPQEWLRERCHLETVRDRYHETDYLEIPYYGISGQKAVTRKRYGKKEFRWAKGSAGKICLYGEWRIPEFQQQGYSYVILVEGESDTQSLWYMGLPAIGVPGASMFKPEMAEVLQGLRLYIHKEPDKGGDTFLEKISAGLREIGFQGEVFRWECAPMGSKDPSDLYLKHGKEEAEKKIQAAIKDAAPVDYQHETVPEAIPGAPIHLRQPEGWIYSDKGIARIDEKQYTPVVVCRTPVILTQRLQSLETGEEKIEVAFKRDGKWQTATFPRSTIFKSQSITTLADLGCTITSENAKQVVRFLQALEAENIDLIPKVDATSTFGWQPGRRFIPGHDAGITLDIDPSQRGLAAAYCQNGTFERWKANMAPPPAAAQV